MPSEIVHIGLPHYPRSQAPDPPRRIGLPEPFNWPARTITGFRWEGPYRLRAFPNHTQYGTTTPTSNRVTRVANIVWGDGDADVVRHTGTSFHETVGGVYTSRIGAFALAAADTDYWGGAVVQSASATNPGKGVYLFSARSEAGGLDHIFFWTGTGNISNTWVAGAPEPGRFVINFADRAFIFNQIVAGQTRTRRGQWSIPGEALTWTGTGSGTREFAEFDTEITSAFVLRGSLYVSNERSILVGNETYQPQAPVNYAPVTSSGIGVWAPNSLVYYEDQVAFLSLRGFMSFDGRQFRDIGGPDINQTILQSILNRSVANVICAAHLPAPWNLLIWALPLSGAATPNQLYAYDYVHDTWLPTGGSFYFSNGAVTALNSVSRSSSTTWQDWLNQGVTSTAQAGSIATTLNLNAGDVSGLNAYTPNMSVKMNTGACAGQVRDIVSNTAAPNVVLTVTPAWTGGPPAAGDNYTINRVTWKSLQASGVRWSDLIGTSSFPVLLSGHATGQTRVWNTQSGTNTEVTLQIDTPIMTFEGLTVGRSTARADDIKTLDAIEVLYRTVSGDSQASSIMAFVSTDEGLTFQHYGTASLTTTGSGNLPRKVRIDGRISGPSFIIRLASSGFVGTTFFTFRPNWMLEDWWVRVRLAGQERSVA